MGHLSRQQGFALCQLSESKKATRSLMICVAQLFKLVCVFMSIKKNSVLKLCLFVNTFEPLVFICLCVYTQV